MFPTAKSITQVKSDWEFVLHFMTEKEAERVAGTEVILMSKRVSLLWGGVQKYSILFVVVQF